MAPRGHVYDGSTVALWRLNEASAASNLVDVTGVHTLTQNGSPPVVAGVIDNGRTFDDTRYGTKGNDAALNTTFLGSHSIELWIKPSALRSNDVILAYTGPTVSETLANNYLGAFAYDVNGNLLYYWEHDAGVDEQVSQVAGSQVAIGAWQHLAVTCEFLGTTRTVRLYRNGVKVHEEAGKLTANGGTSANLFLAKHGPFTNANVRGDIDDVRLSNVVRTDEEILQSYQRGLGSFAPTRSHLLDGSTLALWRLEEENPTDAFAEENNVYPLTATAAPSLTPGLFGRARTFNGTTQYGSLATNALSGVLNGNVTAEAWVYLDPAWANTGVVFGYLGAAAVLAENALVYLNISTARVLQMEWEFGAAQNVTVNSSFTLEFNRWYHVVGQREVTGGTATGRVFINGALAGEATGLTLPSGGTSNMFLTIGRHPANLSYFKGQIEEVRVSATVRTPTEIFDSFLRGMAIPAPGGGPSRLPIDANLLGYWGFDEPNESDPALDEGLSARHLAVSNSPSVVAGRVGNSRQFSSLTPTYAFSGSAAFGVSGDLTLMTWARLSSFNSTGSLLRTLFSCNAANLDASYALHVDNSGRLVYKHQAAAGTVVVRTAINIIKVGKLSSIVLRRFANAGNQDIQFFIDNVLIPVADVTVNAVGSALPVPPPVANASPTFYIGRGPKESDNAYWDGFIDEASVHNVARANQPYLKAAYFKAISTENTARLSTINDLNSLAAQDMGGQRWWTYERDNSIYVVREGPVGLFSAEVQVTTTGTTSAGGTVLPELIYDPANDLLVVIFLSAGRVFKITAAAVDAPVTQNMPFTADTPTIIKARDQVDLARIGNGGAVRSGLDTVSYNYPATPTIAFTASPSFGLAVNVPSGGYFLRFYQRLGGVEVLLATYSYPSQLVNGIYFHPISQRVFGNTYFAVSTYLGGNPVSLPSAAIVDFLGRGIETVDGSLVRVGSPNGDVVDGAIIGNGSTAFDLNPGISMITRGAVKNISEDPTPAAIGNGGPAFDTSPLISMITRGAVKNISEDPSPAGIGNGGGLGFAMADNRGHNFP